MFEIIFIAGLAVIPLVLIIFGVGSIYRRVPPNQALIVYGWGPGCNGATGTARALLAAGLDVRELLGGYEYWVRNGFATESDGAITRAAPDRLVTAESAPHS